MLPIESGAFPQMKYLQTLPHPPELTRDNKHHSHLSAITRIPTSHVTSLSQHGWRDELQRAIGDSRGRITIDAHRTTMTKCSTEMSSSPPVYSASVWSSMLRRPSWEKLPY